MSIDSLGLTRRHFFSRSSKGIGIAALVSLLSEDATASGGLPGLPHFPPKAKRVIYLFQHGAPSQLDLFDYKPKLAKLRGTELPDSIRKGQRLTGMTAYQTKFPTAPSIFNFDRYGQSGLELSELLPYTAEDRRRYLRDPLVADRRHQSRSGRDVFPDRIPTGGSAEHRRVDLLRAGQRESGPAGVCGDGVAGRRQLAGAGGPSVGQRLSAHQLSGREVPLRRRSCALLVEPPGLFKRCAGGGFWTIWQS